MSQHHSRITPNVRLIALLISTVIIFLGACILGHGYVSGRFTRFGYTEALDGTKAKEFGSILILIGCIPLLLFCKTANQATSFGLVLGVILIAVIFITAYL